MSERYKQLQDHLLEQDLFRQQTIADYFFLKTLLFAQKNLNEEEFRLFQRFFHILNNNFPPPDLLVYLYRPVAELQKNIRHRGRDYEQDITDHYLHTIQSAYLDYFKTSSLPILILDLQNHNFMLDNHCYLHIVDLINRPYQAGIHRLFVQ